VDVKQINEEKGKEIYLKNPMSTAKKPCNSQSKDIVSCKRLNNLQINLVTVKP